MTTRQWRAGSAGVTLVEMLVVLALFAVVSGAAVMALPTRDNNLGAETQVTLLAHDIGRAIDHSLAQARGFGIAVEGDNLRFVQRDMAGAWAAHADTHLAKVKLFPAGFRISGQDTSIGVVFAVSPALVPEQESPLYVVFGAGPSASTLIFDGAQVRIEQGEGAKDVP